MRRCSPTEAYPSTRRRERTATVIGRGGGIRTRDIQLPKLALYQAELRPDARKVAEFSGKTKPARLAEPCQIAPIVAKEFRNLSGVAGDPMAVLLEQIRTAVATGAPSALGARVVVRRVRRGLFRVEREGRR